ncbi:uncharacterized protein TRIADDRAFT_57014 [Trichoplax adhaerens]|uniref:Calponin-homology (CH) domain-containing protein n=1 Tax=Trichoplax adhaerens TaxID=10228 RepID=B3RX67_TRIAD|nr:hypothetical protein TRIADDRAFT_57014 [Trichoplax adhaerens]EDV25253.1 hypothetical protein TRIADDRAFT_57014 [Trichoplax adhaerens]|eukprot:XP_002113143.1 hypothetical protein TRIADDRAFT_57014 [Trichoplax adhaerens]
MADIAPGYWLSPPKTYSSRDKRDLGKEMKVLHWISAIIGRSLGDDNAPAKLRDGIALCELINQLQPGSVSSITRSRSSFGKIQNISKFLKAAELYGVNKEDLFLPSTLYDGHHMVEVINAIESLALRVSHML